MSKMGGLETSKALIVPHTYQIESEEQKCDREIGKSLLCDISGGI